MSEDFEEMVRRLEKLETSELKKRIASGDYNRNPTVRKAADFVWEKRAKSDKDIQSAKSVSVAQSATAAAWVAAIAALVSLVISILSLLFSLHAL